MSYCRHGIDSDVYVYGDENHLVCVPHFRTGSYQMMLQHLKEHRKKGDKVPNRC